jgi:excisionase family DNA binding protein
MTQPAKSALPEVSWLTVQEVADYLRVTRMTVYRMIHNKQLPAFTAGGRNYRIDEQHVKALVQPVVAK